MTDLHPCEPITVSGTNDGKGAERVKWRLLPERLLRGRRLPIIGGYQASDFYHYLRADQPRASMQSR
jgi:hypothetical protein